MVGKGLPEIVAYEQRHEIGKKKLSHVEILSESIPGTKKSKNKGLELASHI